MITKTFRDRLTAGHNSLKVAMVVRIPLSEKFLHRPAKIVRNWYVWWHNVTIFVFVIIFKWSNNYIAEGILEISNFAGSVAMIVSPLRHIDETEETEKAQSDHCDQ